jgi:hypothetical protein
MASLVLCGCESLTVLRFRHLLQHFLKPGDFEDICQQETALCSQYGVDECVSKRAAQNTENVLSARVIRTPAL